MTPARLTSITARVDDLKDQKKRLDRFIRACNEGRDTLIGHYDRGSDDRGSDDFDGIEIPSSSLPGIVSIFEDMLVEVHTKLEQIGTIVGVVE